MSLQNRISWPVLLSLAWLTACSTPQPARDTATHTASMVTQMETQLRRFRKEQEFSAKQRIRALAEHEATMRKVMANVSTDARIREVIGATEHQVVAHRLRTLADGAQADDEELQAALSELSAQLDTLFKPLPDTSRASTDTAKALGAMGTELPLSTRVTEFRAAIDAVRQAVDELNSKAESARRASTPAATESAP